MTGAAMGIMTVVGHATDSLVNAVGLASLLYARRKVTSSIIGKHKLAWLLFHGNRRKACFFCRALVKINVAEKSLKFVSKLRFRYERNELRT